MAGKEIMKKIIQSRVYRDPLAIEPPDLDYDLTYPITTFEAVIENYIDEFPLTLKDKLQILNDLIDKKQSPIDAGTPLDLVAYSGEQGKFAGIKRVVEVNKDDSKISDYNIPTEKAVANSLKGKVDTQDFIEHSTDEIRHILEDERNYWNNKTDNSIFVLHDQDNTRHITTNEREAWNRKADLIDFETHRDNINNPHKVTASQLNVYTRQEVLDLFESAEMGFFRDKSISYDGILGIEIIPYDPKEWNPNFLLPFQYSIDSLSPFIDNSHTFIALRAATNYLTNASDSVEVWIKRPNLIWAVGAPSTVQLKNGDLFIKYPDGRPDSKDNELWVWLGGQFKQLTLTK